MLTKSLILTSVFVASLAIDEYAARDQSAAIPKVKFWDIPFVEADKTIFSKFDRNGRIVGGNEVVPNAHPYQAALFLRLPWGTGLCGGCLITNRHIITAAHCLDFTLSVQALLGGHDIFTVEPTQVRLTIDSSNYIVHESYDPQLLYNDVALLPLPQTIVFNDYIHPIALPTDMMDEHFAGEIATVSGWGRRSDQSASTSPVLHYTRNEIKDNEECEAIFGHFVIGSTLCTVTRETNSGTCNGDSGGPLTIERGGRRILIATVSFGLLAGCELGYPTGYARMTYFLPWITANIEKSQ